MNVKQLKELQRKDMRISRIANQGFREAQMAASDAQLKLDAEKELELPTYLQSRLKSESEALQNILKEYGEDYQGPCTLTDA